MIWQGNFYQLHIALRNDYLYHIPITRTVAYYNSFFYNQQLSYLTTCKR